MKVSKEIIIYILMLFMLCLLCPHDQFEMDKKAWADWSIHMLHNGYGHAYNCETNPVNYNPVYLIILRLYAGLMGSDEAIQGHIFLLKYFTLLTEWIGVIYLCHTISARNNRLANFLFCFLNIGFLYNTLMWGQIDGMLSAFIVCSIVALYRGNLLLSALLYVLALNTKLVAIFYLPVWGLLFLQQWRGMSWGKLVTASIAAIALQLAIIFPFIRTGNLQKAIDVNLHAVGYYQYLSLAAYNMWHLIFPGKLDKTPDTILWGPLSYRQWGFLLFYFSAFVTLLPLMRDTWHAMRNGVRQTPVTRILLCGGLLCLSFFYFSTEMHERYSHICLWFFAGYAFVSQRWAPFILASIAVFLNMAMACSEVFALQYKLISVIFALAMIVAFIDLYKKNVTVADYAD